MGAATAIPRQSFVRSPRLSLRLRQITLFAAILISGGVLSIPRLPLLIVVLLLCFALKNPLRMLKVEFALVWVLLAATVAVALIGGDTFQIGPLTIRLANFLGGIALLMIYVDSRPQTLAMDLHPILRLMAVQAVLTPVIALLAPGLFWTFQVDDTVYDTFLYIFTYHEFIEDASFLKRPDGFFFEPGVFQMYLNVFLFIALFVRRFSAFDIGLATVAVIATQSTTGAVILAVQYAVAYFRWLRTAPRFQKLAVFILGPIFLVPVGGYATYNLGEKFYGQFRGSAEAREYDLRTGLRVIDEHPLTGIGFDYEKYFEVSSRVSYRQAEISRESMINRPNTNGIIFLLYSVGIPLGLVFLLGLWRQRLFRPRWVFAVLIFFSLLTEPLIFTPFLLMIVFSGLLIPPRGQSAAGDRRHKSAAQQQARAQTV